MDQEGVEVETHAQQKESLSEEGEKCDGGDSVVARRKSKHAEGESADGRSPAVAKRRSAPAPSIISITPEGAHEFKVPPERTRIPAQVKNEVLLRDGGSCQHLIEGSGAKCGARRFVEVHHRVPVEKGGENHLENLITLCQGHHFLVHFEETG